MDRIRLPLATFALFLVAACQPAPTAPAEPQTPVARANSNVDSILTGADRNGNLLGSGN